jgi:hypothetical protein
MSYGEYSAYQQNPQFWNANQQGQGGLFGGQGGQGWGHGGGLGQAAFGQQGGFGGWQQGQGQGQGWGGNPWQRQLSHYDIGEVVRHLIPLLPQIVGQAQQQPQAAFGYGGFGNSGFGGGYGGYGGFGGSGGYGQRQLSHHDVQEVVRQILPVVPQIISLLQGQQQGPLASAMYGGGQGWGGQQQGGIFGQGGMFGQGLFGQGLGQAAYGGGGRQFSQYEVGEILRHLSAALPQVIANLQALNQQQQQRGN